MSDEDWDLEAGAAERHQAKVIEMREARKKRASKEARPSKGELSEQLLKAMLRQHLLLPPFPWHLAVLEIEPGARLPAKVDDSVVTLVPESAVVAALLQYTRTELADLPDYQISYRAALEIVKTWLFLQEPLNSAEITPVRWQGEAGLTYRRLPWELGLGEAPTWEGLLKDLSNVQAFIKFVGSLLHADAYRQQYLWIHGEGGDGKGCINRFLAKVLGNAYAAKQPPDRNGDKFWNYGLIGKRAVAIPDTNSRGWITSGHFKALTGGDPLPVEGKGSNAFTFMPQCSVLIFSNNLPGIKYKKADLRRLILCSFPAREVTVDPEFEDRLWAEGGAFLSLCLSEYRSAHPKGGPIACDTVETEALAEQNEEEFEMIFEKLFHVAPPWVPNLPEDKLDLYGASPSELQHRLLTEIRDYTKRQDFIDWLKTRKGVRRVTVKYGGGEMTKRYVGVSLKKYTSYF